jgi:hypothetical protein
MGQNSVVALLLMTEHKPACGEALGLLWMGPWISLLNTYPKQKARETSRVGQPFVIVEAGETSAGEMAGFLNPYTSIVHNH